MASLRSRMFCKFFSFMPRPPWTYRAPPTFIEKSAGYKKGATELTLPQWRTAMEQFSSKRPLPKGTEYEPVTADGITGEWVFKKKHPSGRTLLYLHGGGYVINSAKSHRSHVANIANAADARVLNIDYRLAPEHPFPAAVEDAVQAYRWLLKQDIPPQQIAIAGDSAGGGLTVATMLALKEAGDQLPGGGVCLSPWFDLAMTGNSNKDKIKVDKILDPIDIENMAAHYLQQADPETPTASPLYGDLTGLPPLLIHVGTDELLLDDSRRFAELARQAGVEVQLDIWEGMFHVWHLAAGIVPEATQAIGEIADFLKKTIKE